MFEVKEKRSIKFKNKKIGKIKVMDFFSLDAFKPSDYIFDS